MKNKLTDLQNHLFAQLERLGEEQLSSEQLAIEVKRSQAMSSLAKNCIDNAALMLEGAKFQHDVGGNVNAPDLLGIQHAKS